MKDHSKKLLLDVVEAGRSIVARCAGRTFVEYEADRWFRRVVEREFEIIGEALNRLDQTDPTTAAAIAELPRIVGFRNRIIHAYGAVDNAIVWGIVEGHLPELLREIQALLDQQAECL
jgi:uncharacterized protein with HEPN domain